jgi:hypothetical protein
VALLSILVPASTRASLETALAALYALNVRYLETHPQAPRLYSSGVRYVREPRVCVGGSCLRREHWQTIPVTLERREGDCEDLASWRAAELTVRDGTPARPSLEQVGPGQWHVVVRTHDGRREDPSARLGMHDGRRR